METTLPAFTRNYVPHAPEAKIVVPAGTDLVVKPESSIAEVIETPIPSPEVSLAEVVSSTDTSAPVLEQPPEAQAPTRLSELMVALVRADGGTDSLKLLLGKLQAADIVPETARSDDKALCTTLDDLLKIVDDPGKLEDALTKLEPSFCISLKEACSSNGSQAELEKYASLAIQLIQHGPVMGAYAHLNDKAKTQVLATLKLMHSNSDQANANPEAYAKTLAGFKQDLFNLIQKHNTARSNATNFPDARAQGTLLQIADANFKKEQVTLIDKYSPLIAKADAERLAVDLTTTDTQTKEDPLAAKTLTKYMKMLFSPEGAAIGAMLVPFLASILSGTLGQLPFIGPILQPFLGLSTGLADMAQKLVQTISMVNQAKTSQQVAAMQKSIPPAVTERKAA